MFLQEKKKEQVFFLAMATKFIARDIEKSTAEAQNINSMF